jgi:hypothetical protein
MASFTSTTHALYISKQWADELQAALESNLVLAKLVKQIEFDRKVKGDVVHIPLLSNPTAADISESDVDISGTAPTESEFTLTINKKKHVTFYIPKHLGADLSHYDFRKPYSEKIAYALAKIMDDDLFALWSTFTQQVGTTADGYNGNVNDPMLLRAIEYLDAADIPQDERAIILAARQKSKLLGIDKFIRADAVGPDAVKIEKSKFGEIYSAPVYFTSNTPTKLAGTSPATPVDSHVNFFLYSEAMAIAIPQEAEIDFDYLPQKKAWILSGDELYGVAVYRNIAGVAMFTKASG